MSASLLQPILNNSVPTSHAPFVVLTDSVVQPGLIVLKQLIHSALNRNEPVVLISLEQTPSRLLPSASSFSPELLTRVDGISHPPFASTSALPAHLVDWKGVDGIARLEQKVIAAVEGALRQSSRVSVVLDSIDALAEEGIFEATRIVSAVLGRLKRFPNSRLVTLHHNNFPPAPATASYSSSSTIKPALLALLLSPSVSSCTLHLTLHPPALLSLLSRHYNLNIPLNPSLNNALDLKLTSFLASFSQRAWGHPLILPASLGEEDERCGVDALGGGERGGRAVVEWEARGLEKDLEKVAKGEQRKVVQRGLEGVKRTREGVEGVGLEDALRGELMNNTATPLPSTPATPHPAQPSTGKPPAAPSSSGGEALLPFNLSLTDAQKAEREKVVMGYLPKELGGTNTTGPIFGVEYTPDEGDDMDDDDPDEDLEV